MFISPNGVIFFIGGFTLNTHILHEFYREDMTMTIWNVINLLGGLAMFIFGMNLMSDGLKLVAGSYLKKILEKLTQNRIVAMIVGAGLTALIQSSNAMCVMVVGFVNAGMSDSKLEKNRVDGVYAVAFVGGKQHLYYLNMYVNFLFFLF